METGEGGGVDGWGRWECAKCSAQGHQERGKSYHHTTTNSTALSSQVQERLDQENSDLLRPVPGGDSDSTAQVQDERTGLRGSRDRDAKHCFVPETQFDPGVMA